MERGWRITEWSRERGRGRITSDAGTLEFDASVTLVDDFVVDELVDITLERGAVRRIQPRSARSPVAPIEHTLPASWTEALARLNAKIETLVAFVIVEASATRVRIELQHSEWPPPHTPARCTVTFDDVVYIQLPTYSTDFAMVTARAWSSVRAAGPRFLESFAIDIDDVDDECVLVCFEPGELGAAAGFLIARSLRVE